MATNTITLQIGGALDLILRQPEPEIETIVTVRYQGFTAKAKGNQMAYTLGNDHFIEVKVAYVDAAGNPAVVDGAPVWSSSDPSVLAVDVDAADAFSAKVTPAGPARTAQVKVSADADLGTGTRELITLLDVEVVAGEAVAGTISVVGDPQPK